MINNSKNKKKFYYLETHVNPGDKLYFKDKHNGEHILIIDEHRECLQREEKISMILEKRQELKGFLEPRLQMLRSQIYNIRRTLEHKIRPDEVAQETKLKDEIAAINERININKV